MGGGGSTAGGRNHGLPEPEKVLAVQCLEGRMGKRRWMDFRRGRKGELARAGFGFRLEFAGEVRGPFAIGYGAHFGLGLLEAVKDML